MTNLQKTFQDLIIDSYRGLFPDINLRDEVRNVFYETPRHDFVTQFQIAKHSGSILLHGEIDEMQQYFSIIYRDQFLITHVDQENNVISSLSQPSLVLLMLNILPIRGGERVLEIGAGSGWNASMLGKLVGDQGLVASVDIHEQVVAEAEKNIKKQNQDNVVIVHQDGAFGYSAKAPYDIVIYTVGAYDIPKEVKGQVKDGGYILFVLKNHGGGDTLYLLKKVGCRLVSEFSLPCGFVQMAGASHVDSLDPVITTTRSDLIACLNKPYQQKNFWFSGKNKSQFLTRSRAFSAYLSIVSKQYIFLTDRIGVDSNDENSAFGLFIPQEGSLAVFRSEKLLSYGNHVARNYLLGFLDEWVRLGMPALACFELEAVDASEETDASECVGEAIRNDTKFRFFLPRDTSAENNF